MCEAEPLVPGALATPGAPAVEAGGGGRVEAIFSAMFSKSTSTFRKNSSKGSLARKCL